MHDTALACAWCVWIIWNFFIPLSNRSELRHIKLHLEDIMLSDICRIRIRAGIKYLHITGDSPPEIAENWSHNFPVNHISSEVLPILERTCPSLVLFLQPRPPRASEKKSEHQMGKALRNFAKISHKQWSPPK